MASSSAAQFSSIYSLEYIQQLYSKIDFDNHELPANSTRLIEKLQSLVSSPNYNKTPVFKKKFNGSNGNRRQLYKNKFNKNYKTNNNYDNRNHSYGRGKGGFRGARRKNPKAMTDEEWDKVKNFEVKKVVKVKSEFEGEISNLKMEMNKITNDNYETIFDNITLKLDMIIDELSDENYEMLCFSIFEIASSNSFYSSVYAKLYNDMSTKYPKLNSMFDTKLENYMKGFENLNIGGGSKNVDDGASGSGGDNVSEYDILCNVNNDIQKLTSLTKFIISLVHYKGTEMKDKMISMLFSLLQKFEVNIQKEDQTLICETYIEIICIILETGYHDLKDCARFDEIIEDFTEIGDYKPKNYKSFTNKASFRVMDVLDFIEEQ